MCVISATLVYAQGTEQRGGAQELQKLHSFYIFFIIIQKHILRPSSAEQGYLPCGGPEDYAPAD